MDIALIIFFCSILLLAYIFDLSSSLTKIPSVLLLIASGWLLRQLANAVQFEVPDVAPILPILGTIGLILIVMEGSLELEVNRSKRSLIWKSVLMSLVPLLVFGGLASWLLSWLTGAPYKTALINMIPFCIISSAIAIPSVKHRSESTRHFITYESSLSDIFGILLFNFFALEESVSIGSALSFGLEFILIIVASLVAVLGLSLLLGRIRHHVTYTPIILLVILIYAVSKYFHLPGLVFILIFGLALGNMDEFKNRKWVHFFRPEKLNTEVLKFKEITAEAAFLIRALFFLCFGFLLQSHEILNLQSLPWAGLIVAGILAIRYLCLKVFGMHVKPLIYIAPRGLITILLFLSIPQASALPEITKSLVIQVILLSSIVMMLGLMFTPKRED